MSILAGQLTRAVFQGLSGPGAETAARRMMSAGQGLLAFVAEGEGGDEFEGLPVFETVAEAVRECGVTASVVYGEASFAADAVFEAADAGVDLVVCTAVGVPLLDAAEMKRELAGGRTRLIGPGGTSTAVDLGREPVRGLSPAEALSLFRSDTDTEAIVLTGAIDAHEIDECARVIAATGKPIAAYMPVTAAGASAGVCRARVAAAGAAIVEDPAAIGSTVAEILSR